MTRLVDQAPIEIDPEDDEHRFVLAQTGRFGRQAAGAVMVAATTGRFLLMLRAEGVLEPGTYGNCGGAHKADEEPADAARRECGEETGWAGDPDDMFIIPALVYQEPEFTYSNFLAVVPSEFDPMYGWEAVGHVWCTLEDLPAPLHFGITALIADPDSRALLAGGWHGVIYPELVWEAPGGSIFTASPKPLSQATLKRIAAGCQKLLDASSGIAHAEAPWHFPLLEADAGGRTHMGENEETDMDVNLTPMPTFSIRIVADGKDLLDDATVNALFQAGCDDAIVSLENGDVVIEFARAAASADEAVDTASRDVRAAGLTIKSAALTVENNQ